MRDLYYYMRKNGYNVRTFAKAIHTNTETVTAWNCHGVIPTPERAEQISELLGFSANELWPTLFIPNHNHKQILRLTRQLSNMHYKEPQFESIARQRNILALKETLFVIRKTEKNVDDRNDYLNITNQRQVAF